MPITDLAAFAGEAYFTPLMVTRRCSLNVCPEKEKALL